MKRILTLLAAMVLVASGLHILPAAAAEEAPTVPEVVNIEDPYGDANTQSGDQMLPADASTVSDIGKVWFSHDATNFNVHFLTEGPPGTNTVGLQFVVTAGEAGCAVFSGYYKGLTYLSDGFSRLVDGCNDQEPLDGTFTFVEGPEGQGLATMTLPRAGAPLLIDGATISAPIAQTWIFAGGEQLTPSGYRGLRNRVDDTKPGTDYAVAGAPTKPAKPAKPVKPAKPAKPTKPTKPTPPVKNGCDNGKGKKKGCPPKPKACTPVTPATAGKDAPALTLTDAATAEKPAVQKLTLERRFDEGIPAAIGAPGSTEAAPSSVNVTVDTDSKEPVGLYATLQFPARRDYDLWAYFPGTENQEAASSHGFSPLIETKGTPADQSNTASNHGGETKADSENLVGILTPDCGGYTITAYNYLGEGGELDLKLWLGDVKYDPAETPAEGAAATMRASYDTVMTLF